MQPRQRTSSTAPACIGLAAVLVLVSSCSGPAGESARIVDIPRVNLIEIETGETIRLVGVDEIIFPDQAGPMIEEAVRFTRKQLTGRVILVNRCPEQPAGDHAVLAEVYVGDGLFNEEVIRQGYGRTAKDTPAKCRGTFEKLETAARKERRGLWAKEGS